MRKRGGSYLFLPASKALLLGISTGVFEQSKRARKWSESRALATIARARVRPVLGRPTSHLGDWHLIWETDISSGRPTSRPTHHAGARREHFRWIQTSRKGYICGHMACINYLSLTALYSYAGKRGAGFCSDVRNTRTY